MTTTKRTHRWLAGSGLVVLALTGIGCSIDDPSEAAKDDVNRPWTCTTDEHGILQAEGTVTNHSSKASFYTVTVEFTEDGEELASASATADHVEPNETRRLVVSSGEEPNGSTDCRIDDVARFKA